MGFHFIGWFTVIGMVAIIALALFSAENTRDDCRIGDTVTEMADTTPVCRADDPRNIADRES